MELIFNFTIILLTVFLGGYLYYKWRKSYWERMGIPVIETSKSSKANLSPADGIIEQYTRIKERGLKHAGGIRHLQPSYFPVDNEIIKCIFQKDFEHFTDHGTYLNEEADPLSGHLFNLQGSRWKNLRNKLSPTFTSGKMKMMFPIFVECSNGLEQLLNQYAESGEIVDMKEVAARFTTDIIGSTAFGVQCNSLKDPEAEFRKLGKKVFEFDRITVLKYILVRIVPMGLLKLFGLRITSKELEYFLMKVISENIEYRKKNKIIRKDFLDLLIQLKDTGRLIEDESGVPHEQKAEGRLTFNELAAQCYVFFLAGFETSSTTMTFAMYELAINQDIQNKVRQEVTEVLKKHNNEFTYEAINEMTYLEKVFSETLRKYPPLPAAPRICTKDYTVPGTTGTIEAGTHLNIPIMGIHHDPEYYPNPKVFDPERFSEENKAKRPPYTYVPFGEGPRICIGLRFGRMQTKVGIAMIIKNFKVTLNEKTIHPLQFDSKSFILSPKGGMYINVSRI